MTNPTAPTGAGSTSSPAAPKPTPAVAVPRPAAPRPVSTLPKPTPIARPSPGSAPKPIAPLVKAADLRPEDLFRRLYWLEGIRLHQQRHIKDLNARLQRTGTTPPDMPHFEPLKSPAGDIDPNVG